MGYRPTFLNTRPPKEAWEKVKEHFVESGFLMTKTAEALGVSRSALMKWFKKNPTFQQQLKDLVKKEMDV